MSNSSQYKRLSAVLMADIAGYTRLIETDTDGTVASWQAARAEVIDPKIAEHAGRIVKLTGDGFLAEFSTVQDAVKCAIAMQNALVTSPLDFRMGVNLGDVIDDGSDIHGEGVNIAARIEAIAAPGGVCISGIVFESVRNRIEVRFVDLGEHNVKHVSAPVRVWHWRPCQLASGALGSDALLALPDKPSIAVLPFDNMSGDPEQEFFADGIAEEIITSLSRFRSLFVIARNSSFSFKGSSIDVRRIARDLGVRYVVEGSVRKSGSRVRISAQLIDATSGSHLWADRFDGSLDDVFDLQDEITEKIVVAVEPEIQARERERARRKPPESLDAWELLQRGLFHFYHINETDHAKAISLFKQAIALDPEFAAAHAHLAYAIWGSRTAESLASARASAQRAVSLDPNEPMAHFALGRVHVFSGEPEMAIAEMQTAIAINPNDALAHYGLGQAYWYGAGEVERALPHFDTALRLSPRSPLRWLSLMLKGSALSMLGRHDEAITVCREACQFPDAGFLPRMHLAEALAEAGQMEEARAAVERAVEIQPDFSIAYLRGQFVNMHDRTLKSLLNSLRKAGVPE